MGACQFYQTYKGYDWKSGIQGIQNEYEAQYGSDFYNGGPNNIYIYFSFTGDISNMTKKQQEKYILDRLEKLSKCEGEVVVIENYGFDVISTKFVEHTQLDYSMKLLMEQERSKSVPMLVYYDGNGKIHLIERGNLTDLKKKAHKLLRQNHYSYDLYIVRKDKYITCTADVKHYASTKKTTDEKYLVVKNNTYAAFGWAPE